MDTITIIFELNIIELLANLRELHFINIFDPYFAGRSLVRTVDSDAFDYNFSDFSQIDHNLKLFLCMQHVDADQQLCLMIKVRTL